MSRRHRYLQPFHKIDVTAEHLSTYCFARAAKSEFSQNIKNGSFSRVYRDARSAASIASARRSTSATEVNGPALVSTQAVPGTALPSVIKAIANLRKNLARIQIVRSAKGKAVVQQYAAVCDVDSLDIYGETLPKVLADGKVERGMRLEMVARNRRV